MPALSLHDALPIYVARVNEVARAISLGRDQELLHDIPQEYRVDQQHGISDPVGMTGTRLEVEMYLVTVQATAAQNLRKAVQRAGYRVLDLVLEPLAAAYAVLTEDAASGSSTRSDRKSTRLNSSHEWISYAVFCLKKKKR